MTKADLIAKVSNMTGKEHKDVTPVVEAFIKSVNEAMVNNEPIYIRGFGTFKVITRKPKVARNIGKGTSMTIPAHSTPKFTFAKRVKERVKKLLPN